ncbi:uncharacterized protein LOC123684669 [Harmonia axyridis]|uniref:uncharacterized protein LOC123683913 n=1 Tax=Harmonia axyridis TaxID=115357 RepID=UPI001E2787FF|nr:uncharacterized protein LOC123683913 [Harmonia axyridis]XP_045479964.1 uncharacterized protein LOC123684669 [Harmonia axyridis]
MTEPFDEKDLEILEQIKNTSAKVSMYPERLRMAQLIAFDQRRLRGDLVISFRIAKYNYANHRELLIFNNDPRLRGHTFKLKKEKFATRQRQYFLFNRIFETWNGLPGDVVNSDSVNSFKNKIDSCLFG